VPENLLAGVKAFAEDLRARLGDTLLSVTIYGSAARGDYIEGVSDVNVLVITKDPGAPTLRAAGAVVRQWRDRLPLSPAFASADFVETSSDVFPIEFLEMRDWHLTVDGPDPFEGLQVDSANLRRQVEAEMKGKLLRLRSAYARAAGRPVAVLELMRDSMVTFRALFGGALRLKGLPLPARRDDVFRQVAEAYGVSCDSLDGLLPPQGAPQPDDADALFGRYIAVVDAIVHAVDRQTPRETHI
jgi:hypothetical protein